MIKCQILHRLKKLSCTEIVYLLSKYELYKNLSLYDFHGLLNDSLNLGLTGFKSGNVKLFYEKYTYKQFSACIDIKDDAGLNRTIHKSKGAEFDNILIVFPENEVEDFISFLKSPDLSQNEKYRVFYVALSRARKNILINIPVLSESDRKSLEKYKFDFISIKSNLW